MTTQSDNELFTTLHFGIVIEVSDHPTVVEIVLEHDGSYATAMIPTTPEAGEKFRKLVGKRISMKIESVGY